MSLKEATGAVLWILSALWLSASPIQAQGPGQAPLIDEILFEGNQNLHESELAGAMRLKAPSLLRPLAKPRFPGADFLAGDLNSILILYRERGYPLAKIEDAVVRYDSTGEKVDIVIVVEEGPLIRMRELALSGVIGKERTDLLRKIRLVRGDPLSSLALDRDELAISSYFEEQGRTLVQVLREVHIEGDSADVVYRIDPGPLVVVESIHVGALERTEEETVRRELTLKPGDLLTPKGLLESRRRLLDTGIFRSVRVQPEITDSLLARAALHVGVRERKQGWVGAGAGYSSSDRLRFLADWGIRNISGQARRVSVNTELYYSLDPNFRGGGVRFKEGQIRLAYLEPRIFDTRYRFNASIYNSWLQEQTFHERTLGYAVAFVREFGLYARGAISFESRNVDTTEQDVKPQQTTRFVRLTGSDDRRNNPFDASFGRYLQGQVEYAGGLLGGTNEFGRIGGFWQGYTSPERDWVLAARVSAGYIEPFSNSIAANDSLQVARVPWGERYRLGGSNTVRGYPEDELGRLNEAGESIGGLTRILANVEVRFPLFWIVRAGLFVDLGNVWADPKELKFSRFVKGLEETEYNPLNVFYGVGGGLRFVTPIGPLRIDYGLKVGSGKIPGREDYAIHVALGQAY